MRLPYPRRCGARATFSAQADAWVCVIPPEGPLSKNAQLVETQPAQNTADGGGRNALGGDLLARPALTAQPTNLLNDFF